MVHVGDRLVPPMKILHRMAEGLRDQRFPPTIRRDGRAIELYLKDVTQMIEVLPGFLTRTSHDYPVYSIPGENGQWIETSPARHDAVFLQAHSKQGAKLRAISQLVRAWQCGGMPPFEISGLYVDMLLASSAIGAGVKSYGQCLSDFFQELVYREVRNLDDPSGVIVASSSSAAIERAYKAATVALKQTLAALASQGCGNNAEANRQWEAILRRKLSRHY
jgi:hypothetical protein